MKKNLTIYLPNGDVDIYRQDDEDVKDIMLLNNGVIIAHGNARVYEGLILVNIPYMNTFVFNTVKEFKAWLDNSKGWSIA